MSDRTAELIEQLRAIEESLRDLAYDRLRDAGEGDEDAVADEKRLQQARRAVERAVRALGGPSDEWGSAS
jgi:hypothetical protein